MNIIKINEYGEVDINSFEMLSTENLAQWIKNRLFGEDNLIPEDYRQGDSPYYIIYILYGKSNRYIRFEIENIVLSFLKDMARNPNSLWKKTAGDQLLLLTQALKLETAIDLIYEMANSNQFSFEKFDIKLHYRILQTLVALNHRVTYDFWINQFKFAPDIFFKVVFDGLTLISLNQAIDYFVHLESNQEALDIIYTSFPALMQDFGANETSIFISVIKRYWTKMKPDIRSALIEFFRDEDIELKIIDNPFDFDLIRRSLDIIVPNQNRSTLVTHAGL